MSNTLFSKAGRTLDLAGSGACVLVCGILIWGLFGRPAIPNGTPVGKPISKIAAGLKRGVRFTTIPGINYDQHKHSIIAFVDSTCVHCVASIPVYQELKAAADKSPESPVALIGAFPSSADGDRLKRLGFPFTSGEAVSFYDFKITATPTVVAVGSDGNVENFWIGELPPDARAELKRLIETKS